MKVTTFSTSGVSMKAHWILIMSFPLEYSMSPFPISWSAPVLSKMVLESTLDITRKATLAGKLALIIPVMTFTEGLCVAMMRWIPTALASCARRAIGCSTSLPAVMIKSANSSTTSTMYGR